jgi:hypothetical protein
MLPFSGGGYAGIGLQVVLLYLQNVTFLSEAVILDGQKYVVLTQACHPRYWPEFFRPQAQVTYEFPCYDSALCVGHQHSSDFGHWFLEVFPCYAALPADIVAKSVVVVPERYEHVVDGFSFLGVNPANIIAGVNIPLVARHYYTVDFQLCGDLNSFLITKLRHMMVDAFALWRDPPSRFLTYNRVNMSRAIANYQELRTAIATTWPKIPWEDSLRLEKLADQAVYFNTVKFLFGVHGSVLANMIFMQDETAVVDLQMEQWLLSFLWLAAYTGKHIVVGRDPRITWRGMTPNVIEVKYVLQMFERALRAIKEIE